MRVSSPTAESFGVSLQKGSGGGLGQLSGRVPEVEGAVGDTWAYSLFFSPAGGTAGCRLEQGAVPAAGRGSPKS